MTRTVLELAGVESRWEGDVLHIPGRQRYAPFEATVEADWSQAAFWYAAIALGSKLELEGLNAFSVQGDMAVVPHFLRLTHPGDLTIDLSDIPDLLHKRRTAADERERPAFYRLRHADRSGRPL